MVHRFEQLQAKALALSLEPVNLNKRRKVANLFIANGEQLLQDVKDAASSNNLPLLRKHVGTIQGIATLLESSGLLVALEKMQNCILLEDEQFLSIALKEVDMEMVVATKELQTKFG